MSSREPAGAHLPHPLPRPRQLKSVLRRAAEPLRCRVDELGRHRGEAVGAVCHTNDICGVRADVDDSALPRGRLQRVELVQKPRYLIGWDLGVGEDAHRGRHGSTICSSRS